MALGSVKGRCLSGVTFWEELLRGKESQNSVGRSVNLEHFAAIKL